MDRHPSLFLPRVHARFLSQAVPIRRAFHRANPSHRRFPQQAFSASNAFAPRADHPHPDLLKRMTAISLRRLPICPVPLRMSRARHSSWRIGSPFASKWSIHLATSLPWPR